MPEKATGRTSLGTKLNANATTEASILHRRSIAENTVRGLGKVLFKEADPGSKLETWSPLVVGQALHDCRTLHLQRDNLHELGRWERTWTRKIFRLKPSKALHEQSDRQAFNDRTANLIYALFFRTSCTKAVHRALVAIHREAYREMTARIGGGCTRECNSCQSRKD